MSLIKLKNKDQDEKKKKILITTAVVALLIGLMVGINLNILNQEPLRIFTETQTTPVFQVEEETGLVPLLYEEVSPSVVLIEVTSRVRERGTQGSGFIYKHDGYILTNNHVIEDAEDILVTFQDGNMKKAELIGGDPYSDIAVIKVNKTGLKPIPMGSIDELRPGQTVLAIGNPFGLEGTITKGIVSQKNRLLDTDTGFTIPDVIQTDAAINPGNSGGPLITLEGKVVGMNTAIRSGTGTFVGVGFAVSVETIKNVAPELIEKGRVRYSWIGIKGRTMTYQIAQEMETDQKTGVIVAEVTPSGPADKAGLQEGQRKALIQGIEMNVGGDIITSINGEKIHTMESLISYLGQNTKPGETVKLGIIRNNEEMTLKLTLEERP